MIWVIAGLLWRHRVLVSPSFPWSNDFFFCKREFVPTPDCECVYRSVSINVTWLPLYYTRILFTLYIFSYPISSFVLRSFFPSVESRLAVHLNLSPNVTTIMTGNGNIPSYVHRLKIIGSPECPCKHGIQTVDHLIFQCKRLKHEREILKSSVLNPLNAELNPICHLLALLGVHHFLHVSRIRVKSLTLRLQISYIYIYGAPILDVSRSHTTTHYSR